MGNIRSKNLFQYLLVISLAGFAACGDNAKPVVVPDMAVTVVGAQTTEQGGQVTLTVVFGGQPSEDVTVPVMSSDTAEGTVSPALLTFTRENYAAPQTVIVTGVDDPDRDGDIVYSVTVGPTASEATEFSGLSRTISLTNIDNETASYVVSVEESESSEDGDAATFSVALTAPPTADVVLAFASDDATEGGATTSTLTFTAANFAAPQEVTVLGVDDDIQDGTVGYNVVFSSVTTTDPNYVTAAVPAPVALTNRDNDSAAILVSDISGPTTEGGTQATFDIRLQTEPAADVTIELSSGDPTEGSITTTLVTFTALNWNAPQVVVVTGVDDNVQDGNQPYEILFAAATSADANYQGLTETAVSVLNIDDETAGVSLAPVSGDTSEGGGAATFDVVLTSEPTADVVLDFVSDDLTEGVTTVTQLTFTAVNWNAPQTITVIGQDDPAADGNQVYAVVFAPVSSGDPNYAGLTIPNVEFRNLDDETPGILVSAVDGDTTEAGGQATFAVVLQSQPSDSVAVTFATDDATEGTTDITTLVFTDANWNAPQIVLVTGLDDAVADGNQPYQVDFMAATSFDLDYNGLIAESVDVVNVDNDSAGIIVTPMSGDTGEDGTSATFTVVLTSEPTANVTVQFNSDDVGEGTVGVTSLTFTAVNWAAPQSVTVTGEDDDLADGAQPYQIDFATTLSSDADYAALVPQSVDVVNVDNDSAGITVSRISGDTDENGTQATFSIVLNSQPFEDVVVNFSSDDVGEGTLSQNSLTFTSVNWNAPQIVTVTGINDDLADGSQPYQIDFTATVSSDSAYATITPASVDVVNTDNDTAGIVVTAIDGDTNEGGAQAQFSIVLTSEPFADVTIAFATNDATEGVTLSAVVTFTAANWSAPQFVVVEGINDDVADGNQPYAIVFGAITTADVQYAALAIADVAVVNVDNDTAGITVTPISGDTGEDGAQATFSVVLNSEPTADVVVNFATDDATEGTSGVASLTFTAINWNAPQFVVLTGANDDVADGNQPYEIDFSATASADLAYAAIVPASVAVLNIDDDSAGIVVSVISGDTDESGASATFSVVLQSEPTTDVMVNFVSDDATEGSLAVGSLTFTSINWNAPQVVTVTGVNDDTADGDQPYQIDFAATVSGDASYAAITPDNVDVVNSDDDSAGIRIGAVTGQATESGGTASFTIELTSQPFDDVTVNFASDDTGEGVTNVVAATFTSADWNVPQTITVEGQDDDLADGAQPFQVDFSATTSTDAAYNVLVPASIDFTNTDNDTAGITVGGITADTTEAGGVATFDVVLNSEPFADVTVNFASDDTSEGVTTVAALTFTPANWNVTQTVTVTGQDDAVADGGQPYQIDFVATTSTDTSYAAITPASVDVTNIDDDSAGFTVSTISGNTTEAGGSATFTIALTSEPVADVTVNFSSSDATEGATTAALLTFTAADWNVAQTVTVVGVDDAVDDNNITYAVAFAATTTTDPAYAGLVPASVTVINIDDETTCGDLIREGAEECDDGNTVAADGCGPTCELEICGDSIRQGAPITSVEFRFLVTGCNTNTITFATEAGVLYTATGFGSCTCTPGIQTVVTTNAAILAAVAGNHTFSFTSTQYVAWAGIIVNKAGGIQQRIPILDVNGGGHIFVEPDLCIAQYAYNTSASLPASVLIEQCDDGNMTNGDGCENNCTVTSSMVICGQANEGGTVNLSCPGAMTMSAIEFASYGTPGGACNAYTIGGCHAANSIPIVTGICGGNMSCAVGANNTVFGDPCGGTGKRLYVQARCN